MSAGKVHGQHSPRAQFIPQYVASQPVRMPAPNSAIAPVNSYDSVYSPNPSASWVANTGYAGGSSVAPVLSTIQRPTMPDPKDEKAMLQYQEELQAYNRLITMLTNIIQIMHDTQKAVIQHFRS